jgi:hypothetical protein
MNAVLFNTRGYYSSSLEIQTILNEGNIDVALITETHLTPKHKVAVAGFRCYRKDRPTKGGGVMILVREKIIHTLIPLPESDQSEMIGVKFSKGTRSTSIICLYNPPNHKIEQALLHQLLAIPGDVIVGGDFNARHRFWNCARSNPNGKVLFDFVTTRTGYLHYPAGPTFLPSSSGHTPSTLDLLLCNSPQLVDEVHTRYAGSSDHLPVFFTTHTKPDSRPPDRTYFFNRANWDLFREELDSNIEACLPALSGPTQIDSAVQDFTEEIKRALRVAVPIGRRTFYQAELPQPLQDLIREKNQARKRYQEGWGSKEDYNFLTRLVGREIKKWRQHSWDERTAALSTKDGSIWRLARSIYKGGRHYIPPLKTTVSQAYTDEDKANVLVKCFAEVHNVSSLRGDKCFTEKVSSVVRRLSTPKKGESFLMSSSPPPPPPHIKPTSPKELVKIINSLKKNKAPGHDDIPNIVLKNLSRKAVVKLTNLINSMLSHSYFPESWKKATIFPLPKPHKDPTLPNNYRPISLLPTLAKVAERVIHSRLQTEVTRLKLIPKQQFGFQRAHSTVHQLGRVIGDVSDAMTQRLTTALLLLDSEKAFDSVWIEGLVFKLMTYKIPTPYCRLIHSYLTDRQIQVRVDKQISLAEGVESGVPQGSVLSPILYNLYIADLMTDMPPHVNIAGFADDIALYTHSSSPKKAVNRIKNAAEQIISRLEKWKIKVNETKTEAILLTKLRDIPRDFKIRGTQVEFKQCVKYLGVHIDSRLTWATHIKTINQTAKHRLGRFYRLLRSPQLSDNLKLLLFKAIIRPCLTYACPVWQTAAKSNISKLQITQNKCLRVCLSLPRRTPIDSLHRVAGIPLLTDFIDKLTTTFSASLPSHPNHLLHKLDIRRAPRWTPKIHKTK